MMFSISHCFSKFNTANLAPQNGCTYNQTDVKMTDRSHDFNFSGAKLSNAKLSDAKLGKAKLNSASN